MTDKAERRNWFKRHPLVTGISLGLLLIFIGISIGVSGNNTPPVNTQSTSNTSSSNDNSSGSTSSKSSSASQTAHVGDTVTIDSLGITLVKVIDPASGADQYTTPDAGKRFVAVDVKIQNNSTSTYSDDANNDVTLIGSDGQDYSADFDSVSECTNFNDGQFTIASGEAQTGCVVYQVPDSVTAKQVQFQDSSGSTAQWDVP